MAGLPEQALWDAEIYQIEQTDPVVGGLPNLAQGQGITNVPHQALANRTAWLKAQIEALQQTLTDLTNGAPGAMDTLNELAAALGDDPNFAATVLAQLSALQGSNDQKQNSADFVIVTGSFVPTNSYTIPLPAGFAEAECQFFWSTHGTNDAGYDRNYDHAGTSRVATVHSAANYAKGGAYIVVGRK